MMKKLPEIVFEICDHSDKLRMKALALELGLPLRADAANDGSEFVLKADAEGLALCDLAAGSAAPTRVDFLEVSLQYRLRTSGKRQGIGKAIGLDKVAGGREVQVLDATAGLGRDALVLAHLGCRVTMIERSPILHAMLAEGLLRAAEGATPAQRNAIERLTLVHGEAREYFSSIAERKVPMPDVIYLDPMFPPRDSSAKVKKDIAALHRLLGAEQDLASLVSAALPCARHRVVLKRPDASLDPALPAPTLVLESKAACFAIYVNSSFSSIEP